MGNLLDELKSYLETLTPDQKHTDWMDYLQQFEKVGPDAKEFVEKQLEYNQIEQTRGPVIFDYIQREGSDDMEIIVPDCKEIIFENGRYILRDRKPKYPKTYEECEASGFSSNPVIVAQAQGVCMRSFARLIVARNTYWKIAGEQMGLDKPWEPDWNGHVEKYYIYLNQNEIKKSLCFFDSHFLTFPTEEMRDAFFENFEELIEQCKYFL